MTIRNAADCSTRPSGSDASGSPKTMMPPAIADTLAAAAVKVMTGTASPFCNPRADAKKAMIAAAPTEGNDRGRHTRKKQRVQKAGNAVPADLARHSLDRHVGHAEEDARGD